MNRIILQSDGRGGHPIKDATGYSLQSIHRLEKAAKFPPRLALGDGKVGWLAAEVEAWLASRARGPLPPPACTRDDGRAEG